MNENNKNAEKINNQDSILESTSTKRKSINDIVYRFTSRISHSRI